MRPALAQANQTSNTLQQSQEKCPLSFLDWDFTLLYWHKSQVFIRIPIIPKIIIHQGLAMISHAAGDGGRLPSSPTSWRQPDLSNTPTECAQGGPATSHQIYSHLATTVRQLYTSSLWLISGNITRTKIFLKAQSCSLHYIVAEISQVFLLTLWELGW